MYGDNKVTMEELKDKVTELKKLKIDIPEKPKSIENINKAIKLLRGSGSSEDEIRKYITKTKTLYFNEDGTRKDSKDHI